MLADNYPRVTAKMKQATIPPLYYIGETSERYTGTTIDAIPTPSPTIILPIIRTYISGAKAIKRDPPVNKTSEIIITGFLPIWSDKTPAINEPINAPRRANETVNSL